MTALEKRYIKMLKRYKADDEFIGALRIAIEFEDNQREEYYNANGKYPEHRDTLKNLLFSIYTAREESK